MLAIARKPDARLREIAIATGVTERTAYAIVADLTQAGYVVKQRDGRRNHYHIQEHLPLATSGGDPTIGELVRLLSDAELGPSSTV